ncbi:MAG: N-acetylmuramoyl-L-alanine amidase [Pseudomonadota bacterium]|nr:N-acetylmuramoyl-L-alanine amidase [Pseudomonadota bacterium]
MKISRRNLLKVSFFAVSAVACMPRMAFAARNSVKSLRTGAQPNGKTRLVIETASRPAYSLSYPQNQLVINLANTTINNDAPKKLASGTLAKSITQVQNGDSAQIVVNLTRSIADIAKSQIMILSPNGDNDYRLVLDFVAGTGTGTASTTSAAATTSTTTSNKSASNKAQSATPAGKYVIVIDAGHGGKDPGCIGKNGTKEKTVVLSVARKLRNKLNDAGFKTYLTRNDDTYLKLADRAAIGERRKADLFISLHANANPSRAMKGFSVYTLSEKASDEEAKKLAEAENAADKIGVEGFTDFEPNIRSALSALQQHAVAEMSEEYANGASRAFRNAKIEQQRGPDVRHAPFAVLRSTVPGALIELGHLSNAGEEKLLNNDAHQNKLVAAIVKSVKNYNFDV